MESKSKKSKYPNMHPVRVQNWYVIITILLYVCIALLVGLLAYLELELHEHLSLILLLLVAFLGVLGMGRALLTLRRNQQFEQAYVQQEHETYQLGLLLTPLVDILDDERLREQALRTLISILGYDVVMLFIMEEQTPATHSSQPLLVNVASSTADSASWRFWGANKLTRICQAGQETTVNWSAPGTDEIAEFDLWLRQQQTSVVTFFPLIYHGKKFGALGLARRAPEKMGESEASLLRLYAEQLAILLEHARLYEESGERETFSRAIANIATRLNAAVIEPVELSQLICEEGGHALKADHTLFYLPDEQGERLLPLSCWAKESDGGNCCEAWPAISLDEPDGQAFYDLQPTLLTLDEPKMRVIADSRATYDNADDTSGLLVTSGDERDAKPHGALRETLWRCGGRSAILTPLMAEGEPIGLLVFVRAQAARYAWRAFSVFDLPHAQDFGEQAAVAFTNARLYEQLRTAHRRLQELDQMKDQFMVTASHELRTPLTAVQGYIELIAQYDDILPPEDRRDFLDKARRGCDELAMLLSNVMDASRLERDVTIRPALLKRVSVKETVESVVVMIEPNLTKEKRELQLQVPDDLYVKADPMRLRQVLLNIGANALKYSKPQTPITIIATAGQDQVPVVTISVEDQGKGIKPEDQESVFQRFYRLESDVNSPVRGSGLGLYISKRLIEAMGGKIWIESSGIEGEGSTFSLQLPMA